jgi:alpha-L-fucosidase
MKKSILVLLVLTSFVLLFNSFKNAPAVNQDRLAWWREARFGLFIHWGIYSVPAGVYKGNEIPGIGEWIMNNAKIPVTEYADYATQFNPVHFNAEQWVLLAKEVGMKYIVITSKHHDGFAMFGSKASRYNIVDATPFKRDPLKELAATCKKYGIRLGFYYSQAQDWHHAGGTAIGGHWDPAQDGNMDEYIDKIALPQVKEILSNYGPISILWWDTPEGMTPERAAKFLPLLKLQPGIIVNNRLGGGIEGDFQTPEQYIPPTGIPGKNWEACMTMNDTWGFKSNDHNWKSAESLVQNLIDIASKGGNYLLNVGPNSLGEIPEPSVVRLKQIGAWLKINGEAIYGTQASPFNKIPWGRCTQKKEGELTKLYLHVFDFTQDGQLKLDGLQNGIVKAYALADPGHVPLKTSIHDATITIDISREKPSEYATVIVLEIKGAPRVYDAPEVTAAATIFIDSLSFQISSNRPEVELRYTLDDSEPGVTGNLYKGAMKIAPGKSLTVKAKCYLNNKAVSGTTEKFFQKVIPAPAAMVQKPEKGLTYKYYQGIWSTLPDFSALNPVKSGTAGEFDLALKEQNESYGFVFTGLINVPVDNVYTFYLESDDGSKLMIDGKELIDNDGLHAMVEKTGEIALAHGFHIIGVYFFQRGGGDGLNVSWSPLGKPKLKLAPEYLYRDGIK